MEKLKNFLLGLNLVTDVLIGALLVIGAPILFLLEFRNTINIGYQNIFFIWLAGKVIWLGIDNYLLSQKIK
jgi:hypothetical protein